MVITHGIQLCLLSVTTSNTLASKLVGNSLYALAWSMYVLHTFWGYSGTDLPFHDQLNDEG
jgi:hypothetical protein